MPLPPEWRLRVRGREGAGFACHHFRGRTRSTDAGPGHARDSPQAPRGGACPAGTAAVTRPARLRLWRAGLPATAWRAYEEMCTRLSLPTSLCVHWPAATQPRPRERHTDARVQMPLAALGGGMLHRMWCIHAAHSDETPHTHTLLLPWKHGHDHINKSTVSDGSSV